MQVVPLSEVLGVELVDFDATRPCGPQEQAQLRRLLAQHHLLAVRGQDLTEEDQSRFVGYFGPLHVLRSGGIAGYVTNQGGGIVGTGTEELRWHIDGGYGPHPGLATSLWAQEAGDESSPTMFANAVRALAQLPPDIRSRIEPLSTVHMKDTWDLRTDQRWREIDFPDPEPGRIVSAVHPIVYQLPYCDEKTLFVNQQQTSHVVGLALEESEALLQDLWARLYADDNVYLHRWQTNDLVIWGNSALHHGRGAMGSTPRHLRRQSLDGWYTDQGVLDWPESVVPAPAALIRQASM